MKTWRRRLHHTRRLRARSLSSKNQPGDRIVIAVSARTDAALPWRTITTSIIWSRCSRLHPVGYSDQQAKRRRINVVSFSLSRNGAPVEGSGSGTATAHADITKAQSSSRFALLPGSFPEAVQFAAKCHDVTCAAIEAALSKGECVLSVKSQVHNSTPLPNRPTRPLQDFCSWPDVVYTLA